jgi:F-type H+-transporting ATPase subunit b
MKFIRNVMFLALLLGACGLIAQEQGNAPKQAAGDQKATSTPGRQPDNAIRDAQRELAHQSNEAAGIDSHEPGAGEEKDETAEFKQSPSVKKIASLTGLSLAAAYWLLVLLNFAIIAALVIWAWKKNVPAMFRARGETIRKNLEEARRASEDANRRLGDIESRLAKLDSEIAEMRQNAEAEAAKEEEHINVQAEEDRKKVVESAEQEIDAAAKAARRELKAYAASLAVSMAEKKIQVDPATDKTLVSSFVRELTSNGGKGSR